jgi:ankyrin repeat protein
MARLIGGRLTCVPISAILILLLFSATLSVQGQRISKELQEAVPPLVQAAAGNDLESVRRLLTQGEYVNSHRKDGYTALMAAAEQSNNPEILALLLEKGAKVDARTQAGLAYHMRRRTEAGWTALHFACRQVPVNLRKVQLLVEHRANVEARTENGQTPLMLMARQSLEGMKYLLEKGANIKAKDDYGGTLMLYAAQSGKVENLRFLRQRRLRMNAVNRFGGTVASAIASTGNLEAMKFAVENGAPLRKDKQGSTVLMYAAAAGADGEMAEYLIGKGQPVNARNVVGDTAAISARSESFLLTLLKYGAAINVANNHGRTPLQVAEAHRWTKAIALLKQMGANSDGSRQHE